jgi:antitoxin component YwqK of YwqJK toxin-antitoxin module
MLGYKIAKSGDTRVLVTLEIPPDALTNLERASVAKKETAAYRTNKAKVLKIEDANGTPFTTAKSYFCPYTKSKLIYNVGNVVEEPDYDRDIEKTHTDGIHFQLKKSVAKWYGISLKQYTGVYCSWNPNGHKRIEESFKDGVNHGPRLEWHSNGTQKSEEHWENGIKHGIWREWYENGRQYTEEEWSNGKEHGIWTVWYENGAVARTTVFYYGKFISTRIFRCDAYR